MGQGWDLNEIYRVSIAAFLLVCNSSVNTVRGCILLLISVIIDNSDNHCYY